MIFSIVRSGKAGRLTGAFGALNSICFGLFLEFSIIEIFSSGEVKALETEPYFLYDEYFETRKKPMPLGKRSSLVLGRFFEVLYDTNKFNQYKNAFGIMIEDKTISFIGTDSLWKFKYFIC